MFSNNSNVLGVPQVVVTLTTADWQKFLGAVPGGNTPVPLPYPGTVVTAMDPVWGEAAFMLAYGVAGLQIGDAVVFGPSYASTRGLGASRGVIGISMAANIDPTALSWFAVRGQVPARMTAAAANLSAYLTATAGSLATTVVAGQQTSGAIVLTALAATFGTKLVGTLNGSNLLAVPNLDGLYVGCGVTGTGIPAATTVIGIGYGGLMLGFAGPPVGFVQLSANATATGNVTGTFLHGPAFATAILAYPIAAGLG